MLTEATQTKILDGNALERYAQWPVRHRNMRQENW
jgi:hypothetical protein